MQKKTTILTVLVLLAAFAAGFFLRPAVCPGAVWEIDEQAKRLDMYCYMTSQLAEMVRSDLPSATDEQAAIVGAAAYYNLNTVEWTAETWNVEDWMFINIKPDFWEVHIPVIDCTDRNNPTPRTRVLLVRKVGQLFYARDKYHARF